MPVLLWGESGIGGNHPFIKWGNEWEIFGGL